MTDTPRLLLEAARTALNTPASFLFPIAPGNPLALRESAQLPMHARSYDLAARIESMLKTTPGDTTTPTFDDRTLATVLAALRFWQNKAYVKSACEGPGKLIEWDIASNGGTLTELSYDEIDRLCDRLNAA